MGAKSQQPKITSREGPRQGRCQGGKERGAMKSCRRKILISVVAGWMVTAYGGNMYSLYTDHTAMREDDILTVMIVESAKAGSQTGTNTDKKSSLGVESARGSGPLKFIPGMGASGGFSVGYDGKAGTSREGNLVARVTARVTEVLDNGNLVIEGSKLVEINNEKEIIKISGVVRPQDIESDNVIYSYNVADARISYSGKGAVHDGHRPGLVSRFLNWVF
ncbi:MAG: hypothetical protein GF344_14635 [Chitinivibrionales bacterium]|nr:hypothetical protein [Chitinivibrionales bacterium]MBD3357957.1 hypothetical protein [Chitinivibrionales bacterium]